MKRHPALVALSQDHHHALVVAQHLRRAEPDSATDAVRAFQEWWEPEARLHFRLEEELLLPALAAHADPRETVVIQTLIDHLRIKRDASLLDENPPLTLLRELGRRLADHVRLEEQQLFPLIAHTLPDHDLEVLGTRLRQEGL